MVLERATVMVSESNGLWYYRVTDIVLQINV
jgi:hypothetical protein